MVGKASVIVSQGAIESRDEGLYARKQRRWRRRVEQKVRGSRAGASSTTSRRCPPGGGGGGRGERGRSLSVLDSKAELVEVRARATQPAQAPYGPHLVNF